MPLKDVIKISEYSFNKKQVVQNFCWFQFYVYKFCMIMCTGIAP